MSGDLENPIFHDETKARKWLESVRWPDGPYCPHCGSIDKITKLEGKSHRPGLYKCNQCSGHFSVTVGTVYERSHVPLHKWMLATHLITSSKKGISAHQLHRMLGVTYKTAWFMAHRIREGMKDANPGPLGGEGKTVEADETFQGPGRAVFTDNGWKMESGTGGHRRIVTLIEREGRARSLVVSNFKSETIRKALAQVDRKSELMTDEANHYKRLGREFAKHESVNHSKEEYARGKAHINSAEGFFSIFKRGMTGVYQHCGEQHLQRYVTEFDFRYSNRAALKVSDAERRDLALKGISGKRLTYRRTNVSA